MKKRMKMITTCNFGHQFIPFDSMRIVCQRCGYAQAVVIYEAPNAETKYDIGMDAVADSVADSDEDFTTAPEPVWDWKTAANEVFPNYAEDKEDPAIRKSYAKMARQLLDADKELSGDEEVEPLQEPARVPYDENEIGQGGII